MKLFKISIVFTLITIFIITSFKNRVAAGENQAPVLYKGSGVMFYDAASSAPLTKGVDTNEYGEVINNGDGTVTADYDKLSGAYNFKGWFNENGELKSTDNPLKLTETNNTWTPKIASSNVLRAVGSFENTADTAESGSYISKDECAKGVFPYGAYWGQNGKDGYFGYTFEISAFGRDGTEYKSNLTEGSEEYSCFPSYPELYTPELKDENVKTGSNSLKLSTLPTIAYSVGIPVKPDKTYEISYFVKTDGTDSADFYSGVLTTLNLKSQTQLYKGTDFSKSCYELLTDDQQSTNNCPFLYNKVKSQVTSEFSKVKFRFTTANTENINTVYLCFAASDSKTFYLDDLICVPVEPETMTENKAAICIGKYSKANKDGLRIYNSVNKNFVADSLEDRDNKYVEFGSIAALEKENLRYEDKATDSKTVVKGKSYDIADGTKHIMSENEDTYCFTAYLTGITDYAQDYYICTYGKTSDGSVIYGETVKLNVFKVANEIDTAYSDKWESENVTDNSKENDVEAFILFAIGTDNGEKYVKWCADNGKQTGALYDKVTNS